MTATRCRGYSRPARRSQRKSEPQDSRCAVTEDSVHARRRRPRSQARSVSVRNRKHGDQGVKSVDAFLADVKHLIDTKAVSE